MAIASPVKCRPRDLNTQYFSPISWQSIYHLTKKVLLARGMLNHDQIDDRTTKKLSLSTKVEDLDPVGSASRACRSGSEYVFISTNCKDKMYFLSFFQNFNMLAKMLKLWHLWVKTVMEKIKPCKLALLWISQKQLWFLNICKTWGRIRIQVSIKTESRTRIRSN